MKRQWFFALAALVVFAVVLAVPALAEGAEAGTAELKLLKLIFTGYIGLALGFAVAVLGIILFAQGQVQRGVTLMVLGTLITVLPTLLNVAMGLFCSMSEVLMGAGCGPKT